MDSCTVALAHTDSEPSQPSTTLISIPPSALLNCNTLKPLYPLHFYTTLTSTQFVSLHLALQYTRHDRASTARPLPPSPRDRFWPFIETIPRTDGFETVPLSWSIRRKSNAQLKDQYDVPPDDLSLVDRTVDSTLAQCQGDLLECLPASVRDRCADVERRFKSDWVKAKQVWAQHLEDTSGEKRARGRPCITTKFLRLIMMSARC